MNLKKHGIALKNALLTNGITPAKASLSISVGAFWGIFPIIGTSTVLCAITALSLKLNMVITQTVNYMVYPLQVILLIPFYYTGRSVTGWGISFDSHEELARLMTRDLLSSLPAFSSEIWGVVSNTLTGWLLIAPASAAFIYYASRAVFGLRAHLQKKESEQGS